MRRIGKLVKWLVIGLVLAEWYARVGRDFLYGEPDPFDFGVGDTIRIWVALPLRAPAPTVGVPGPIWKGDEEIGAMTEVREVEDAKDMAGHPVAQFEVYAVVGREKVGRPINVALAEIEQAVRQTLDSALAA